MNTRIGILQLSYSIVIEEQDPVKAQAVKEEAFAMFQKGREMYSRLGMVSSFR
jgi:hypothetical protein